MSGLTARGSLAVGLGALLLGGAALWHIGDLSATVRQQQVELETWRATAETERLAAEVLGQAATEAAGVQAELAAEWQSRLDAEQARLESVTAERDRALADLAEAGSSHGLLEQELANTEGQRLHQIGEAARLLEQVLDRERRLEVVNRSLADLREQAALAERPAAVVTIARGDAPASRVSEALRRSGAGQVAVLEGRLGEDGALHDVLARLTGDEQPARLISAERATLQSVNGRASLRFEGLSGDVGDAPDALDIDLPSFDAAAWGPTGLTVPAPFRPVGDIALALSGLLERFGWRLDSLHAIDGATLLGVELSQHDGSGQVLRTLRAARATLSAGPELTLRDGAVTMNGDERAFFDDIFRLPLPGLDTAAWDAALGPGSP